MSEARLSSLPDPALKPARSKVVEISDELHALLKVKAAREGRKLKDLVDEKLREILSPEVVKP